LGVFDATSFIIDFASRTSTGKTTTLRVAVSPWSNPDEHADDSLLWNWDATTVYIERASAVLHSLPVFLDETQRAKDANAVRKALYEVANGRGRSRGNMEGVSRTRTWRTVMFSTGEMPATSFTNDGGTRARCIEIRELPFGRVDGQTALLVGRLKAALASNYGLAGPEFIQFILASKNEWEQWKAEYRESVERYTALVPQQGDPAVKDRIAHYFAAIRVAAHRVHEVFGFRRDYDAAIDPVWREVVADTSDATGDIRALRHVVAWAHSKAQTFLGRHVQYDDAIPRQPVNGWSGRWDAGNDWKYLAFFPNVLDKVLTERGYMPEAIREAWKARGWLDIGKDRGYDKTVYIPWTRESPRMIVIRRTAIEKVEG
jgi:hypothetical protein